MTFNLEQTNPIGPATPLIVAALTLDEARRHIQPPLHHVDLHAEPALRQLTHDQVAADVGDDLLTFKKRRMVDPRVYVAHNVSVT